MKKLLILFISVCLSLFVVGCSSTDPAEFIGWWSYDYRITGAVANPPFYHVEIKEDASAVFYGEYGEEYGEGSLTFVSGEGLILTQGDAEYDIWSGIDYEVRFIDIGNEERYSYRDEKPSIIGADVEPYDPYSGSEGFWSFDENSTDIEPYYTYIEIENGNVTTYDENGAIIEEHYLDYDEQRGLNGNNAMWYLNLIVDFGENADGKYFDLSDPEKWQDGYSWSYQPADKSIIDEKSSSEEVD